MKLTKSYGFKLFLLAFFTQGVLLILGVYRLITLPMEKFLYIVILSFLVFVIQNWKLLLITVRGLNLYARFMVGFIGFSLIYFLIYIITSLGSPFIYESYQRSLSEIQYQPLGESVVYSGTYSSLANQLGAVHLAFNPIQFPTQDVDVGNVTQTVFEQKLVFEIAETGEEPFYTNNYTMYWSGDLPFVYPFGFLPRDNSNNRSYTVTVSADEPYATASAILGIGLRQDDSLAVVGRHVIPVLKIFELRQDGLDILLLNTKAFIDYQLYILLFSFFVICSLLSYLIYKTRDLELVIHHIVLVMIGFFALLQALNYATGITGFPEALKLAGWYLVSCTTLFTVILIWMRRESLRKIFTAESTAKSISRPWWKSTWFTVLVFMLLAFTLRAPNLDVLDPYSDEYPHLLTAKGIVEGRQILDVPYTRSFYTVTLPVSLAFRLLGKEIWAARMVGVLFSVLAMIPLFLITKRINRTVAFFALFLYATSPWVIALSRLVREYAYYPFYFYWIVYVMIRFYESLPDNLSQMKDYIRVFLSWRTFLWVVLLIIPIIYSLKIDPYSTFKVVLIAYIPFPLLLITKMDMKSNLSRSILGIGCIIMCVLLLNFAQYTSFVDLAPGYSPYWLSLFFGNPEQQWYYNLIPFLQILLPMMALAGGMLVLRKNKWPLFFVSLYISYVYFFVFHFDRYFQPRYAVSIEYSYVLVVAIGAFMLLKLLFVKKITSGIQVAAVVSVLLFIFINIWQSLLPLQHKSEGFAPITNVYHDNVREAALYIQSHSSQDEVIIGGNVMNYIRFLNDATFRNYTNFYHFSEETVPELIQLIISHPKGWIVIDNFNYNRYGFNFLSDLSPALTGNNIEYKVEDIQGQKILRWDYIDKSL